MTAPVARAVCRDADTETSHPPAPTGQAVPAHQHPPSQIMRSAAMLSVNVFVVAVPEIYHSQGVGGWVGTCTDEGSTESNRLQVAKTHSCPYSVKMMFVVVTGLCLATLSPSPPAPGRTTHPAICWLAGPPSTHTPVTSVGPPHPPTHTHQHTPGNLLARPPNPPTHTPAAGPTPIAPANPHTTQTPAAAPTPLAPANPHTTHTLAACHHAHLGLRRRFRSDGQVRAGIAVG